MEMVLLSSLPAQDTALAVLIQNAATVCLTRDNTKLLEVVLVLRGARGLRELKVSSAALLLEGEKDALYGEAGEVTYRYVGRPKHNLWDLEHTRPPAAPAMEQMSFTGTIQPGCFRQMEWLAGMLQGALNLKVLNLHVYEYDSERVITDLRAMPDLNPVDLPSMIAPPQLTTLSQRRDEEEGRLVGQMMVAAILWRHSKQPRIEDRQPGLAGALVGADQRPAPCAPERNWRPAPRAP
jgi:hypothetical protein